MWKPLMSPSYIDSGGLFRSKDEYLGVCARNIWLLLAKYNINLEVRHIEGTLNVNADILSRWFHFSSKDSVNVNALKQCVWKTVPEAWLYPDFTI